MIETYALIAAALLVAGTAMGIAVGIVAIVSLGIRHEKRADSLTDVHSPSKSASAARAFHGLYTRTPQLASYPRTQHRDDLRVITGGGGLPS